MSTGTNRVDEKQDQDTGVGQPPAGEPDGHSGTVETAPSASADKQPEEGQASPPASANQGGKSRKWLLYVVTLLAVGIAIGSGWWWFTQAGAGEGKATNSSEAAAGSGRGGSQGGQGGSPGVGSKKGGMQAKPLLVEVESVRRGEVMQSLEVSGEIVATESIVIAATKEGPITFCPWREGDSVRAGEKLVEIDRPIHQAEIEAAEATLSVARAKLADLEAGARPEEIHKAEADVRRWEATCGLCERGVARESRLLEYDAASQSSLEQWNEKLAVAEAEASAAREALEMLQAGPPQTEIAVQSAAVVAFAVFFAFIVLTVQFNSVKLPALILGSAPLCLAGLVFGLYLSDLAFGATVLIAILVVIALNVNDGVLLMTFAEQLHQQQGLTANDAVLRAAKIRLRPRLMTTITTIIGFVPLALNLGEGADMLQPMAIGAIGGLTMEALVALFFMPCLYALGTRSPRLARPARPAVRHPEPFEEALAAQ